MLRDARLRRLFGLSCMHGYEIVHINPMSKNVSAFCQDREGLPLRYAQYYFFGSGSCKYRKKKFVQTQPTNRKSWLAHPQKKCTVARQNVPGHSALLPPNYIAAKSPDVCSIIGTHALESRAHELIRDARRSKH